MSATSRSGARGLSGGRTAPAAVRGRAMSCCERPGRTTSSSSKIVAESRPWRARARARSPRGRAPRSSGSAISLQSQPDRALEPHRAELGGRPAVRQQRFVQPAPAMPGHRARRPCGGSPPPALDWRRCRRAASSGGRAPWPRRQGRHAWRSSATATDAVGVESCMNRAALSEPSLHDRAPAASGCWRRSLGLP